MIDMYIIYDQDGRVCSGAPTREEAERKCERWNIAGISMQASYEVVGPADVERLLMNRIHELSTENKKLIEDRITLESAVTQCEEALRVSVCRDELLHVLNDEGKTPYHRRDACLICRRRRDLLHDKTHRVGREGPSSPK